MANLLIGFWLALLCLSVNAAAQSLEPVTLQSRGAGGATITAYLKRPTGVAKPPVVIALHGCGGLLTRGGDFQKREADWIERIVGWGYAALFVDSFNGRGFREVCTQSAEARAIRPFDRAQDLAAAVAWIATQAALDADRVALIGWSHGGSSTLWSVDKRRNLGTAELKTAIAFYPGCSPFAANEAWQPRVPLTILIGDSDDWTKPEPCRTLVKRLPAIRFTEYPGAVHGFDAPNTPLRVREGLGIVGRAKIGTDPAARAAAIEVVGQLLRDAFK